MELERALADLDKHASEFNFPVLDNAYVQMSEAEFALLEERARGAGMRLGEWVREALLSAPAESGTDSGEVALAEVLALRSLLLNLHFRSATIPEAEMRGLIERADGSKLERLAAFRRRLKHIELELESRAETEPEEVQTWRSRDTRNTRRRELANVVKL